MKVKTKDRGEDRLNPGRCLYCRHKQTDAPVMPTEDEMWADAERAMAEMGLDQGQLLRDAGEAASYWQANPAVIAQPTAIDDDD